MQSLAIFASGRGSNAENIINYFHTNESAQISLIVASSKAAGVLDIAKKYNIPSFVIDKKEYYGSGEGLIHTLKKRKINGIVLAGFLLLIPKYLIEEFPSKILNIHPALLPKYSGKGMYGMSVHEAVWKNKEEYTGISIHEVNEKYDEGKIIFQAKVRIEKNDTPIDIAQKVHTLEYNHFPQVIENYFSK